MPIEMGRLNVHNFSYFAFNPKAAALSERDKRIVILAHVLLCLTGGLGHGVCAIIYAARFDDFEFELRRFASCANSTNRLALAGLHASDLEDFNVLEPLPNDPSQYACKFIAGSWIKRMNFYEAELKKILPENSWVQFSRFHPERIRVEAVDASRSPPIYTCRVQFKDDEKYTYTKKLTEEELKKDIKENKVFIEDLNNLLPDVPLNIREGSRVYRFPLPKIAGLDFPKIDYITVTGIQESNPPSYVCKVIKKNGPEEKIVLTNAEFEEIKRLHLAHIENPYRHSGNPLVNEIQQLTGLDLSIIDKIKVTGTMHTYPTRHCCDITFSNGKTKPWTLENEQLNKIKGTNLVHID